MSRVEVLYAGSWMTVCSDWVWDLRNARVVCRILGLDGALAAPRLSRFGQGTGDIIGVDCYGTEDSLEDCSYFRPSCGHQYDAGAVCYLGVRLVGGSNDAEGTVEVLHDGSWGTICHDLWDLRDARVVCRMLGFDGALEAPGSARFGQGSGRILLVDVGCDGTEDNLADCAHPGIGDYCIHAWDAVRLVGGSNDAEGTVEVLHDGSWGTICHDFWDLRDARVVCRMLGFDGALEAPGSARFGQGSGRILLAGVGCDGTEDNLADCAHPGIGDYCIHAWDAVRLVGGSNDAEGTVEVLHDGSWGTICHNLWDLRDARVVCRMLGFDGALEAPRSARFGQGSGRILLVGVGCDGTEDNLADCAHPGIGDYCIHAWDAAHPNPLQVRLVGGSNDAEGRIEVMHNGSWGTICDDWWDLRDARVVSHPNPLQVRLVGGSNDAEGTVEVLHDGSWGTICHELWDLRDAWVVCRMLGFDGALEAPISARFAHPNPFQVRLVGGSNDAEGRVEVLHDGSWGTICDYLWDLRDARVVCRMLGYDGALEAPGFARFGPGSGRSLLYGVGCDGTEDNLADCAHPGIGDYCSHAWDAEYRENDHPPIKLSPYFYQDLHLIGESNKAEGRVEIFYDGSWETLCENWWDENDAKVVCAMMGFHVVVDVTRSTRFSRGSGDIFRVDCWGTVENLDECPFVGITTSCEHHMDAGAICYLRGRNTMNKNIMAIVELVTPVFL
ncbi:deleted in malignant brain tumors 1 protein-like [Lytechinus variegatus]|uniref:deleted in malignant brain tumors 1 protein-like n=1 Tax=Lytechinus variegatus TaxID=7654 RepID=UPI001BB10EA6|nr:deleted in malignant brain tumors 1 protein-like [Lytechinus variegatus]